MYAQTPRTPTERDARAIVERALMQPALTIRRFPTGLCHYVYDVLLADQRRVVVRIAGADTQPQLLGGVAWSAVLRPRGVPLPRIVHAETAAATRPFPFVILERLPGVDLQDVYPSLSHADKSAIAAAIVAVQAQVGALAHGGGFGYALDPRTAPPHAAWTDVVAASLERSRRRIARARVVDPALITPVQQRAARYESYLARIAPRAFLDDTTTKNVLIERRRVSGIVDVDALCYGDPLWTIGLTRMALLQRGWNDDYTAIWADLLDLSPEQRRVITFYTAVFCVDFLSELGQVFNKREAEPIDQAQIERLTSILHSALETW
jgi:aminoglycoside phosphotransferase (APT) family kinase protein